MLVLSRKGKKQRIRRKTSRSKERTNNKLNPHMTPGPGIEPRPHWWEASALTTAPQPQPPPPPYCPPGPPKEERLPWKLCFPERLSVCAHTQHCGTFFSFLKNGAKCCQNILRNVSPTMFLHLRITIVTLQSLPAALVHIEGERALLSPSPTFTPKRA